MFKPQEPDENNSYVHLVNLDKDNATYMVNVKNLKMKSI